MDEIYQFISKDRPFHLKPSPDCVEFWVTELWRRHSSGSVKSYTKKVTVNGTQKWLDEETRDSESNGGGDGDGKEKDKESLILRLVWTSALKKSPKHVDLPKASAEAMMAKFGLDIAYEYFQSTVTSINAFPKVRRDDGSEYQAYSICYAPKFAAIWSHHAFKQPADGESHRPSVTYGIILAAEDERSGEADKQGGVKDKRDGTKDKRDGTKDKRDGTKAKPEGIVNKRGVLKSLFNKPWNQNVLTHAMFPLLVFGIMFDGENSHTVEDARASVQPVEKRTGYTNFKTEREAASAELGVLSAQMSGAATKLAGAQRRSKALETLIDFMLAKVGPRKDGETQHTVLSAGNYSGDDLIRNHASVLRQRHEMQILDTNYTLRRVQVQIDALINLIAQGDSMTNTDIALSSHRDASSMKTLAFVTMFFLPGSFVSALFSTNCFNWDEDRQKNSDSISIGLFPQFSLYWVITLPLTVFTFVLYWFWLHFQTQELEKRRKTRDSKVDKAVIEFSEVQELTKRRETLLGEKTE